MWNEGYFTEGTYTYGYYRELSPAWQRFCLLANGYEISEPGPDSVHCELGFGQGVSINVHAAAVPGRYTGTDFNPSHARHANLLNNASGAKADLRDLSFAEMLESKDMPQFDSIGMHGVWTWISQDNQKKIVEFVRRYLKPGGVFYNSYNCFPGWAQNHPIRELLTMPDIYARSGNNAAERITNALAFAETAVRNGARHVTCVNRTDTITASQYESSYAKLEGVDFIYNKCTLEIREDGVILADSQQDENGKIVPIPGTEKLYPCTGVIVAVSQGAESNLIASTKDIDTSKSGLLSVDADGHTSRPGVFAAGDAASGARTVVEAVANSKRVAEAMHEYMQSLPLPVTTDYPDVPVVEAIDAAAQAEQTL